MVWLLNLTIGKTITILFLPFISLNPWAAMIFISLLTALLMLLIYKKTSNQAGIKKVKNQIKANLLEIRLYQNDFRTLLSTQKDLLLANARYLAYNFKPLLVMIFPIFLLLAQMNLWFGYRSPEVNETLLLKVRFIEPVEVDKLSLNLGTPAGVVVDSQVLRIIDENEADWRLKVQNQNRQPLVVTVNNERYLKSVLVSRNSVSRISTVRVKKNLWQELLYPGEKPLPADSYVKKIEIVYPEKKLVFLGIRFHWLVAYFLLSIILGLAFKGWFKVEI
jgi:uncharacterized membrane protein (DUF106 family)